MSRKTVNKSKQVAIDKKEMKLGKWADKNNKDCTNSAKILAKISFRDARVDFSLILFDLHLCYSKSSFERNYENLI